MIEIQVKDLVKSFEEGHNVLDGLTFQIDQGERVGLLGKNGAGKTTLFKILTGEMDWDSGEVVIGHGRRLGLISQIPVYPEGYTVEDVLRTAFSRLQSLGEEMADLEARMAAGDSDPALLRRYGAISERFEAFGGYDVDVAVNKIANGLSIPEEQRTQLFDSLAGSWREWGASLPDSPKPDRRGGGVSETASRDAGDPLRRSGTGGGHRGGGGHAPGPCGPGDCPRPALPGSALHFHSRELCLFPGPFGGDGAVSGDGGTGRSDQQFPLLPGSADRPKERAFEFRTSGEIPLALAEWKLLCPGVFRPGVALPTETVYGLGANGLMGDAVNRVFEVKGRPNDNPLILHLTGAQWLPRYCEDVPPLAYVLARKFWPGPLTMILKRKSMIPNETTAGLSTVAVRCPNHPVTLSVIREAGVPIAAPSANLSGRPSCTSAQDVMADMDGKVDAVVDGGPCTVGVESTILDLTCNPPRLLRPGGLPLEDLLDLEKTPAKTAVCMLADKEEIGSDGVTGMQSAAFDTFMEDLCAGQGVPLRACYERSFCLSADVTAAYDPGYAEVYEKRNAAYVNYGIGLCKYTGARGKSGASDADAETVAYVRRLFDEAGVVWQIAELGKVDAGGGGTVACYMANRNITTLDAGVPVLSMHAPFEVVAKLDCYETYKGMKAVYQAEC